MLHQQSPFEKLRKTLDSFGRRFDTEPVDRTRLSEVVAELTLPDVLVDLYVAGSPTPNSWVPWVVEDLALYSIKELAQAQEGYRWTGRDKHALPSWPADWVVVATSSGDPFIADVGQEEPPILFARHGAGHWDAQVVALNLSEFITAVDAFERVLLGRFDGDVWGADGLRQDFLSMLADDLSTVVSAENAGALLEAVAG